MSRGWPRFSGDNPRLEPLTNGKIYPPELSFRSKKKSKKKKQKKKKINCLGEPKLYGCSLRYYPRSFPPLSSPVQPWLYRFHFRYNIFFLRSIFVCRDEILLAETFGKTTVGFENTTDGNKLVRYMVDKIWRKSRLSTSIRSR